MCICICVFVVYLYWGWMENLIKDCVAFYRELNVLVMGNTTTNLEKEMEVFSRKKRFHLLEDVEVRADGKVTVEDDVKDFHVGSVEVHFAHLQHQKVVSVAIDLKVTRYKLQRHKRICLIKITGMSQPKVAPWYLSVWYKIWSAWGTRPETPSFNP